MLSGDTYLEAYGWYLRPEDNEISKRGGVGRRGPKCQVLRLASIERPRVGEDGGMILLGKCLLCKHEDICLHAQHPCLHAQHPHNRQAR